MESTEIIITNILPTHTGFAVIAASTHENVFIPSKLLHGTDIKPGQRVLAVLVPNPTQPEKTPHLAVAIQGLEVQAYPAPATPGSLEKLILDDLEQGDGSAEEIARSIKMPLADVREKLAEMSASGRIVRMETFGIVEAD